MKTKKILALSIGLFLLIAFLGVGEVKAYYYLDNYEVIIDEVGYGERAGFLTPNMKSDQNIFMEIISTNLTNDFSQTVKVYNNTGYSGLVLTYSQNYASVTIFNDLNQYEVLEYNGNTSINGESQIYCHFYPQQNRITLFINEIFEESMSLTLSNSLPTENFDIWVFSNYGLNGYAYISIEGEPIEIIDPTETPSPSPTQTPSPSSVPTVHPTVAIKPLDTGFLNWFFIIVVIVGILTLVILIGRAKIKNDMGGK